jgi:hypothetical protein
MKTLQTLVKVTMVSTKITHQLVLWVKGDIRLNHLVITIKDQRHPIQSPCISKGIIGQDQSPTLPTAKGGIRTLVTKPNVLTLKLKHRVTIYAQDAKGKDTGSVFAHLIRLTRSE